MPVALLRSAVATAAVAMPLVIASCADSGPQYAPACPALKYLQDAADVTTYSGAGHDLTDLLLQARITGVAAQCAPGDPGVTRATVRVGFDLTRGPANPAREIDLPYFLAITDGDKTVEERDFRLRAVFPTNIGEVHADGSEVALAFPITKGHTAAAYTIYVGFRLTPEQLQQNRTGKPRL